MHARSTSPWMRIRCAARIHENPLDRKCVPSMGYLLNLIRAPSMAGTKGAAAASKGGALRQVRHWNRGCIHTMGCSPNPSRTAFPTADECGAGPRVSMMSIKPIYPNLRHHRHPSTPIDTLSRWFTFMPRTVFLLNATPLERMYAECSLRYLLKTLARTPPQSISESSSVAVPPKRRQPRPA